MVVRGLFGALCALFALAQGCAAETGSGGGGGFGGAGGTGVAGTGFAGTGVAGTGFAGTGVAGTGFAGTGFSGTGGVGGIAGEAGGGAAGQDGGCESIVDETPVERGAVDIIWIIDNSCSMFDEYTRVKQNINAFAADISGAGIDHHVVAIVGAAVIPFISPAGDPAVGTALGMDPMRYLYVAEEIGSTDIMPKLISTFPRWSHMLRPNAPTHFVVVTDDESEMPAATFRTQMEGLLGHGFYYHSIASETPLCVGAAAPGIQHYALSDMTMGEKLSICLMDWSPVFARLRDAVITSVPLPCTFTIPPPPPGKEFEKERVNFAYTPAGSQQMPWPRANQMSDCGSQIGWYYDNFDAPTTINLCPAGCTAVSAGGRIDIIFGCSEPPIIVPE